MNSCDFFNQKAITFPSREQSYDMQLHGIATKKIVWCRHKHAPTDELTSESLLDGGKSLLSCQGDFDKCTIPPEKFFDVVPD